MKIYSLCYVCRHLSHLSQMANGIKFLRGETMVLSIGVELEKTSPCCQKPVERTFLCLSSWRGFTVCVLYEKPTKARPDFAGQYTNGTYSKRQFPCLEEILRKYTKCKGKGEG